VEVMHATGETAPLDLTIAIPVRNEEKNIAGCLAAIGKDFCKKIVVIDSGSEDNTIDISSQFGAETIDFKWNGYFPKKRNWYLRTHPPQTKWILFLDADEYVTAEFKQELRDKIESDENEGYWITYTRYFLGKELKGGYPLRKLALFKVGVGEYENIEEDNWSRLDMEVHEHPILTGKTGVIKSEIKHLDYRGVSHYIVKHGEYAAWEAARLLKAVNDPAVTRAWTWKQRLKYRLMRTIWIGPAYFVGSFFLLGGIRDGARGFAFAILKMSYFTQVYCKIRELERKQ
jgi:glycosyltransferase involved in cell wall biosynthesis